MMWAEAECINLLLQLVGLSVANNTLTGPAFPAAWSEPGACSDLQWLDAKLNPGLTGTLPPSLPWFNLQEL